MLRDRIAAALLSLMPLAAGACTSADHCPDQIMDGDAPDYSTQVAGEHETTRLDCWCTDDAGDSASCVRTLVDCSTSDYEVDLAGAGFEFPGELITDEIRAACAP